MNESKKNWFPIVCIVCGIIMVVACIFAIWITVQNSKYAIEIGEVGEWVSDILHYRYSRSTIFLNVRG